MFDITSQEAAFFAALYLVVGTGVATYAWVTPRRRSVAARVFIGGPFYVALSIALLLFTAAFFDVVSHGRNVFQALIAGIGVSLFYGFGLMLYACPAILIGGAIGSLCRLKRLRNPPSKPLNIAPL